MTVPIAMRLLILETSGRSGQVALSEGEAIVARRRLEESRRQARDLAPFVRELLAERGWTPRDLTGVVVSLGPGSYTGLRVGLITAKVLTYALGCALIGVPTFAALADQVAEPGRQIEVLADAQKDKVYVQSFRARSVGEGFEFPLADASGSDLHILPWDAWAATCPPGAIVTGPGALKFADRLPVGVEVAPDALREPHPESLLRRALDRLSRGERDDPFALEPLYLRPSSAEEQWDARK